MRKLTVSVIMSVYNGEVYLRDAIDSILAQTFTDFEFIIIDDGSTDHTVSILRSYSDPRLFWLSNQVNIGQTQSLNRGLAMARGQYIARMDADDISMPERLERQVDFLEKHLEVGLLGVGWWPEALGGRLQRVIPPHSDGAIRWYLLFGTTLPHPGVMFRRELVEKVGFYNESLRFAQDYELWCRMIRVAKVASLPEPLIILGANHTNRVSSKHLREQWDSNCHTSANNIWRLLGGPLISDDRVRKLCGLVFLDRTCSHWDFQAAQDLHIVLRNFLARCTDSLTKVDLEQIASHIFNLACYHARPDASVKDWQIFRQIFLTMIREDLLLLKSPHAYRLFIKYLLGRPITRCLRLARSAAHKYKQRLYRRLLGSFEQTPGEEGRAAEAAHPEDLNFHEHSPYREQLFSRYAFADQYVHGKVVLDIPCRVGWGTSLLMSAKKRLGVDISKESIQYGHQHYFDCSFIVGDMTRIALGDKVVEVVISCEGLEHLTKQDGLKFLREANRVLCSGGLLTMTTPVIRPGGSHSGNPYHLHEYSTEELRHALRSSCFDLRLFQIIPGADCLIGRIVAEKNG